MSAYRVPAIAALAVAVSAALLYGARLDHAPAHLMHDEVNFSLQALSVARTGRDINGRLLPVYFSEPEFTAGRDPMLIYAIALVLQASPLSEAAVRIPTALVGGATVGLLFLYAVRLSGGLWRPSVAAMLLALSPGMFIHSRMAVSVIYPLPFVMIWLLMLAAYDRRPSPAWLAAGAFALGAAVYGYLAAMVMLPVYLAMTVWYARAWRSPRVLGWIAAGAAVALLPALTWNLAHPARFSELLEAYRVGDASGSSIAWGNGGIRTRLSVWWEYFNPDFLFLSGDTSMTNSTRAAGLFPAAFAALLPIGAYRLWRGTRLERLLIAGLITGPLAVVATGSLDLHRYRAMFVLPFGALVAAYGWQALYDARVRWQQIAAVLLLASVPVQFTWFYRDYMGRYRDTSSLWFGGNLRGALAHVYQQRRDGQPLLISDRVPYGDAYARLYSQMLTGASAPPTIIDGATFDAAGAAPGAWLIAAAGESWLARLSAPHWQSVASITEPSGERSFVVFQRSP